MKDAHNIGLRALEVQFLRINSFERPIFNEEVGEAAKDIHGILVTEVRTKRTGDWNSGKYAMEHPLEKGESLRMLSIPIAKDYYKLKFIGEVARELDVKLSLHTPHYMELTKEGEEAKDSIRYLKWAILLAEALRADTVVTYLGIYEKDEGESIENARENLQKVRNWVKRNRMRVRIGIETSGWRDVAGSLDEVLEICSNIHMTKPVLNFGHIHSREGGTLNTEEDFMELFERAKKYSRDGYYGHFSGVEHQSGFERQYTPIKRGDLKFEPLAEAIMDNEIDLTLISSSPLIEHDAMYMKILLERQQVKRYHKKRAKEGKNERK